VYSLYGLQSAVGKTINGNGNGNGKGNGNGAMGQWQWGNGNMVKSIKTCQVKLAMCKCQIFKIQKNTNSMNNNSTPQPKKEGGTNDEDATKSTPTPTPPVVTNPTNLNCSFCDKQLSLDKHKKCPCKTFYCMNSGCQKEHWKVHESEHWKISKALDSVKNEGAKDDTKSDTSSPTIHKQKSCSTCGKPQSNEFRLKICACRTKHYCNKQCQIKQRKQHKKECVRLVKERNKNKNKKNMKEDGTKEEKEEDEEFKNLKEDGTKDGKKKQPKLIQEEEDEEDCPICQDILPKLGHHFVRLGCCGKGLHTKCSADLRTNTSMTLEQKNTCIMCRRKAVAEGSKEEIERLRGWIKKGKAWAMSMLAARYRDGVGVKQSDKRAIELFEMAAKRGNANAQANLGLFYDQGMHGLTQSDQRAIELYTLAAEQGLVDAQFNLGCMYYNGTRIEPSYSKARKWWTKAAEQQHEIAINNLKELDKEERLKSTTTTTTPEVVDPNTISCSTCGKPQTEIFKLKKCACLIAQYCNKQCQKKHRKQHKKECTYRVKEKKKNKNEQNMKGDGTTDKKNEMPIQEDEDKEDCPICTDALPKLDHQLTRLTCCGKGLHKKCAKDLMTNTSMTNKQKMTCIMCRTKRVKAGSKEDIAGLREWVKKRKAWAMVMLAQRYRQGVGVKQSDKKEIELLEMAAKRGNATAQFNLGVMYKTGNFVEQSETRAIELYEMAAKGGHASAQYNLGLYYAKGMYGFTQSSKRAIEYYTLASEQGYVDAQMNLANMYRDGIYVEQSDTHAIKFCEMAAKGGNAIAQFNLGLYYEQGICGLTQSDKRAIEYYTLAAAQGNVEAQYNLGCMYYSRKGVDKSHSIARLWYTKAASQGYEAAINFLKQLDEYEGRTTTTSSMCSYCSKPEPTNTKFNGCERCRSVVYCNRECQIKHWNEKPNGHEKQCTIIHNKKVRKLAALKKLEKKDR
jgi:TPR repeat protein